MNEASKTRKVKSSAARARPDLAAPPPELAQAAAAMGAVSAGPAPVAPPAVTRVEGPAAAAFAAAALGAHLEAGPAPVRRGGAQEVAEKAKRPARRRAVRPASARRRPKRK